MVSRTLLPLAVGVGAFLFFFYVRSYPGSLAGMLGLAFLVLTLLAVRTWERLRQTYDK